MWKAWSVWFAICAALVGCARWSNGPPDDLTRLTLPSLAKDTVVLEIDFVRVPEARKGFASRFWPEVDEQVLDNDVRRRLADNGFRGGVIGQVLPTALQEVLDEAPSTKGPNGTTMIRPGDQVVARSQRLHSRAGHPAKIMVRSDKIAKLAALMRDSDGHIHGRSLPEATLLFQVKSHPLGSGDVELTLTPVIEYGQPHPRYAVQQGVWSIDATSRQTEVYDDLKITLKFAPGQSLVLTATEPPRGLGQQFFGADPAADVPALVLLVRLQQTQLDDRFQSESTQESLATSNP